MKKNSILIIGTTGREHALGWKLKQSPKVGKLYFAPGNAGTESIGESTGINAQDVSSLVQFALTRKIDFTVAGPDDSLAAGVVNEFKKKRLKIFGPTRQAAQIESSKAFAKQLMQVEKIPTAEFKKFTNPHQAKTYIAKQTFPLVIKASGLTLGKGVIITKTLDEAKKAIDDIMIKKVFGKSGKEIIIEEFLKGQEVSIHVFSDGKTISIFPTARDHKPIFDGNQGPNTGGMGTIAPVPEISQKTLENIKKTIVLPVIYAMKKRGIPFVGCLYPGLMITEDGPKVLEFNSRFGDPEMESYMRLLQTDIFDILVACTQGKLSKVKIKWTKKYACCIVLASAGYPGPYEKGETIYGLDKADKNGIVVFHFGTKKHGNKILTNGGRVLGVTAVGKTLHEALKNAYTNIGPQNIHFNGMQYRRDIGKSALRGSSDGNKN